MVDVLYLSPHLDDAVLSCGGRIADEVARGERVLVVTLFTADEPAEPPSRLAADLRRWWRLPAGEVMAVRRREDEEALRRLGAGVLHLGLPEAPYRLSSAGVPFYAELGQLFGAPAADDARAVGAVLAERLRALPEAGRRVAPLAVGGHVDHRLVRAAAEADGAPVRLYEEFPYAEWKWLALRRALGDPRAWRAEALALTTALFEARVRAILAYESQVPAMFRSEARLRKQLRRHLRRAGGERLWQREATR
jgi:LmbE family N-acetylglucosaminyl deacetylase